MRPSERRIGARQTGGCRPHVMRSMRLFLLALHARLIRISSLSPLDLCFISRSEHSSRQKLWTPGTTGRFWGGTQQTGRSDHKVEFPALEERATRALSLGMNAFRRPSGRSELEAGKIETRRDRATDKRPCAQRASALPGTGRHHGLRPFAAGQIRTQADNPALRLSRQAQVKRRARIEMPDFGGVHPMPARTLALGQEKLNHGRNRAAADMSLVAEGLAEMSAFLMRPEPEQPDDVCCTLHQFRLFLRAEIPNVAQASQPDDAAHALVYRR